MASKNFDIFNWYRRYKVRAADMTTLQTTLVDIPDSHGKGLAGVILSGLELTLTGGMGVSISPGIAIDKNGKVQVFEDAAAFNLGAPSTNPQLSMVTLRTSSTDINTITDPTDPFGTVELNTRISCDIAYLSGAQSSTPIYSSVTDDDVILFGVRLVPGQSSLDESDFDFSIRYDGLKNTSYGQGTFSHDTRLLPYVDSISSGSVGIKPSQSRLSSLPLFTYPGRGQPSLFPKTGGVFTYADTFISFQNGAITGGDAVSADFTATIPTGNNSIVATVCLNSDESLSVTYGTQGTLAQCMAGIRNQVIAGAGCIDAQATKYKICYVIVSARSGLLSGVKVIDARPLGGGGGSGGGGYGQLNWAESEDVTYGGPTTHFLELTRVLGFGTDKDQAIVSSMRVPSTYSPGTAISMKIPFMTPATSGTLGFTIDVVCIRPGTDLYGSITYLSTYDPTAVAAGSALAVLTQTMEVTNSSGQVGGRAIQAGDLLKLRLRRKSSDTATDILYLNTDAIEVL